MAEFPTKGWDSGWWCAWCDTWEPGDENEHKDYCPARTGATPGKWTLHDTSTVFMDGTSAWTVRVDGKPGVHMTITASRADAELLIALQNRFAEPSEETQQNGRSSR